MRPPGEAQIGQVLDPESKESSGTMDWATASAGKFQVTMPKSKRENERNDEDTSCNETAFHKINIV
jgi:hypothetical protein